MATLTNTKIKDTYDGLLKTTDNEALDASGVTLIEDGLGNASALSVGRSGNGVSVSGDLAVDTNTLYVNATSDFVGIGTSNQTVNGEILRIAGDVFINSTGTASVPSIALADTNSGFFAPSAGQVAITTQGVERLRIDSSGNVGINEQNPNISGFSRAITLGGADSGYEIANSGVITAIFSGNAQGASISGVGSSGIRFRTSASGATTERLRIDASGNIRVKGTNTKLAWERASDGAADIVYLTKKEDISSNGNARLQGYDGIVFSTAGTETERMRIDSSGNVGIGTSPDTKLDVYGDIKIGTTANSNVKNRSESHWIQYNGGATTNDTFVRVASINAASIGRTISFHTNATERMRITSGGNVLIGTTGSPNGTTNYGSAFVDGGSGLRQLYQASSTTGAVSIQRFYNPNGNVGSIQTSGSSTSYVTSSDYRLKENVVEMTGALDRVDALKPSRFNFIADPEKTVDGFIAHEVAEVVPEAISGEKDAVEEYEVTPAVLDEDGNVIEEAVMGTRPVYQGIDQSKIVPLLVGAIKELRAEIELLKAK